MNDLMATPNLLRQVNLSQLRRALAAMGNATRAELATKTGISSTTIRSLLGELLQSGEVQGVGLDASSGGRKAERYTLCPDRYCGVALCCMRNQLHALVVNLRGEVTSVTRLTVKDEQYEQAILPLLDQLASERRINAIGLGVPGIVEGNGYWKKKKQPECDALWRDDLGAHLADRYGVPVVLENDINATTIGFGLCYGKSFELEAPDSTNMAYLHFAHDCVSAGFLSSGRIIRGYRCFAGELGLVPVAGDKLLDDIMQQPMDDAQYIQWMVQVISWVCGILNPQYIALAGPALRTHCIADIGDHLFGLMPKHMLAELLHAPDIWHDYHEGMAHLTAARLLDTVHVIKG